MNRRIALHTAFVAGLLFVAGFSTAAASPQHARGRPPVVPPDVQVNGKTYAEWNVAWSQWVGALPAVPGHPNICSPFFDVTQGQSGNVWFLAAPFGTCRRTIAIPEGTMLFLGIGTAGASSLEVAPFFGCTEAEQKAAATLLLDFFQNPFCIIDGVELQNIDRYRVCSPQYTFSLPFPNILGVPAGTVSPCPYAPIARRHPPGGPPRPAQIPMVGKAVSDGYWAMVGPLSWGRHTIHFGGTFVTPFGTFGLDMIYTVNVF